MKITQSIAAASLLALVPIAHADFVDTFDGYTQNVSNWDGSYSYNDEVPWVRNGTNDSRVETTSIDGNTGAKLMTRAHESWYHREILTPENATRVTMTASVGLAHGTTTHSAHPRANHIVLGNVALGITGSQISHLLWDGTVGGASISNLTVINDGVIAADTWYTVKIDWNIVSGDNNDTADLYYKLEGASEYTTIKLGLETGADLTSTVYLAQWGHSTYNGAIDNVTLHTVIPEPSAMGLLGIGAVLMFTRQWRAQNPCIGQR